MPAWRSSSAPASPRGRRRGGSRPGRACTLRRARFAARARRRGGDAVPCRRFGALGGLRMVRNRLAAGRFLLRASGFVIAASYGERLAGGFSRRRFMASGSAASSPSPRGGDRAGDRRVRPVPPAARRGARHVLLVARGLAARRVRDPHGQLLRPGQLVDLGRDRALPRRGGAVRRRALGRGGGAGAGRRGARRHRHAVEPGRVRLPPPARGARLRARRRRACTPSPGERALAARVDQRGRGGAVRRGRVAAEQCPLARGDRDPGRCAVRRRGVGVRARRGRAQPRAPCPSDGRARHAVVLDLHDPRAPHHGVQPRAAAVAERARARGPDRGPPEHLRPAERRARAGRRDSGHARLVCGGARRSAGTFRWIEQPARRWSRERVRAGGAFHGAPAARSAAA